MGEIQEAYAEYLQTFSWDYYSTVTFRRLRRDSLAAAAAVWAVLDGKFLATRAFIAVERHVLDGVHCHLLHQHYHELGLNAVKAYSMWLYLFKAFGRTTVEDIRSPGDVSTYCSKYVSKGEQFNLFGEPQAWIPYSEVQRYPADPPARAEDLRLSDVPASPTLWQPALTEFE
ncbi:hypothetical protein ES705_45926 [subsurface metagenome]